MKKVFFLFSILILLQTKLIFANEPDSAYLFSYTTSKQNNTAGLHYAWSIDKENWFAIGPEWCFLFSDFGRWGTQKKMISPVLIKDNKGIWHCIWTLNNEVGQFAHAATKNFYNWKPQSYPEVIHNANCQLLEAAFDRELNEYIITWISDSGSEKGIFKTTTKDFKNYTPYVKASEKDRMQLRAEVLINGEQQTGNINKVSWEIIEGLIKWHEWNLFQDQEMAEKTIDDPVRFKDLQSVDATISVEPAKTKEISDMLIGIFFEDINYAADGGLYAELIQNRGFEYAPSDKRGEDLSWNSKKAWSVDSEVTRFEIDSVSPIHPNNKHYAVIEVNGESGLVNEGFDGIPVKAGEKYNFSVFAKLLDGSKSKLTIRIVNEDGKVIGETVTKSLSQEWEKYEAEVTVNKTAENAKLVVLPQNAGTYALDMISLFPEKTFKGHKNGLRADLAQTIADIHPRFIRFPGGCVAHGDGLENIYQWKNTVGPLEARKPQRNIWNYHQSVGLGYFEYFQFCEDIGAEPVPVLAAGVPCQNSCVGGFGQQGGIPMSEMDEYVQDIFDLIEWANGDKNSKWGKVRVEAGHPEPFGLKYVGIGTVGPFYTGSDYVEGWKLATELEVPMVDEHYYQSPGWFINNQDFYDKYDRSKSKVYLGEYASHLPGRPNNIETALSEALYLTAVERNADIVYMSSYAPLLAKEEHTQWNPDLIYFNNTEVKPTVGYYVQKLYGQNSGDKYIPSLVKLSNSREDVRKRFAVSVVKDSNSNDVIVKLVNLLPVNVNVKFDLDNLNPLESEIELNVLQGKPDDKTAKPTSQTIPVSDLNNYEMSPYSFSLLRFKIE